MQIEDLNGKTVKYKVEIVWFEDNSALKKAIHGKGISYEYTNQYHPSIHTEDIVWEEAY